VDRKTFLRACGSICLGGAPLAAALQGCAGTIRYVNAVITGQTAAIARSEFTGPAPAWGSARPFLLVSVPSLKRPICLYRTGEAEYIALSTVCTHRGCEVRPTDEYLECPCHGSEYAITGEVLRGPAEEGLKRYRTTSDDKNIFIHL